MDIVLKFCSLGIQKSSIRTVGLCPFLILKEMLLLYALVIFCLKDDYLDSEKSKFIIKLFHKGP